MFSKGTSKTAADEEGGGSLDQNIKEQIQIYLFVRFRLCYNYSRSVVLLLGFLVVISRNYNLIVLWKLLKKSRQNIHNTPIRDC